MNHPSGRYTYSANNLFLYLLQIPSAHFVSFISRAVQYAYNESAGMSFRVVYYCE